MPAMDVHRLNERLRHAAENATALATAPGAELACGEADTATGAAPAPPSWSWPACSAQWCCFRACRPTARPRRREPLPGSSGSRRRGSSCRSRVAGGCSES